MTSLYSLKLDSGSSTTRRHEFEKQKNGQACAADCAYALI